MKILYKYTLLKFSELYKFCLYTKCFLRMFNIIMHHNFIEIYIKFILITNPNIYFFIIKFVIMSKNIIKFTFIFVIFRKLCFSAFFACNAH